jgi:DNA-binding Lrp family transcriptional regulator
LVTVSDTKVTWLTQEAYNRLKHELDELIENRAVIAQKINTSREEGDLGPAALGDLQDGEGGQAVAHRGEVHATTGQGDLLVRMVARDNDDLQRVIDRVVNVEWVRRTSTTIALSTPVPMRVRPLLERVLRKRGGQADPRQ